MTNKVVWKEHGDHKQVQHYGESLIGNYPGYAQCGFVEIDMTIHHVKPGDILLVDKDENIVGVENTPFVGRE